MLTNISEILVITVGDNLLETGRKIVNKQMSDMFYKLDIK